MSNVCNEEVFQKIFNENFETIRNYFYYKYGDYEKAKDLTQESFIKLWDNCENVTTERAKGYVFTIAKNSFINHLKRNTLIQKHHKELPKKILDIESPDYLMEEQEFMDKLNQVISSLPDKHREVFLLNRIDGKTYKEIAEIFEVSVKTIEKWMYDSLKIIRLEIGDI